LDDRYFPMPVMQTSSPNRLPATAIRMGIAQRALVKTPGGGGYFAPSRLRLPILLMAWLDR
jgi:hypothetical protein